MISKKEEDIMVAPKPGTSIPIKSYKHNGHLHRTWDRNLVLKSTNTIIIGANDKVKVTESNGETWTTKEPAIVYFHAEYWFNIIGMLKDEGIHYYCNLSSPFLYDQGAIKYIDYDLDIRVFPDMTYTLLDEDEYAKHKQEMKYPKEIDRILYRHIDHVYQLIRQRKGPFTPGFVDHWYERFLTYV